MSPEALLRGLRARGVELTASGKALRWRAPRGTVGNEDTKALTKHKEGLLALLEAEAVKRARELLIAVKEKRANEGARRPIESTELHGELLRIKLPGGVVAAGRCHTCGETSLGATCGTCDRARDILVEGLRARRQKKEGASE